VRRQRGILAVFTLFALATAFASAGWYFFFHQLPHPQDATRNQLFRWLVQRELAGEPFEVQVALVDRLERELHEGLSVADAAEELSQRQREQLRWNFQQLKKVWFGSRANRFATCTAAERSEFLKRQLTTIHLLSEIQSRDFRAGDRAASSHNLMSEFLDDIERWLSDAQDGQRQRMVELVKAGVVHWLATYNLTEQPRDVQLAVVNRIQRSLGEGASFDSNSSDLDEVQLRVLSQNVDLLLGVWFKERAKQYARCEQPERLPFLREQLNVVDHWTSISLPTNDINDANHSSAHRFFDQIEIWIQEADVDLQREMNRIVRDGVVYWLATGDIRKQSPETRSELARRIAFGLEQRSQIEAENDVKLSNEQRRVLRQNAILLFEAWFRDRAMEYESLPAMHRDQFVAEQTSRVLGWRILDFITQSDKDSTSSAPSSFAKLTRLTKLVEVWIERADDSDSERMRTLFMHVQRQLLLGNDRIPAAQP
jgi:hypothetical protein